VDNCVGQNNHRYFMCFLMSMMVVIACFWIVSLRYLRLFSGVSPTENYWVTFKTYLVFSPWICWLLLQASLHLLWVTALTLSQLRQIALGVTTNEDFNRHRYTHLANGPTWSKGCFGNLVEFFSDPQKTDWSKVYTQQPVS
jgi:hypothetical protein